MVKYKAMKKHSEKGILEGSYVISVIDSKTGKLISKSKPIRNKIVLGTGYGRDIILRQLNNDTTYAIPIDSAAIGTGITAPASSDTGLQTSVLSGVVVASRVTNLGNIVLTFFITDAQLANGTYNEFGIFCNSRLFARSLIIPALTKTTGQNLNIEYTITLNA